MIKAVKKYILDAIDIIERIPYQNRTNEEARVLTMLYDILKIFQKNKGVVKK